MTYDVDKTSMLACILHHKRSGAYVARWHNLANSTTSGCSQVNLEGQWWAADVGFGSQVPRQPVPLQAAGSDAAPRQSGTWRPPDAARLLRH
jgi:arylamine N-acetyltransferase